MCGRRHVPPAALTASLRMIRVVSPVAMGAAPANGLSYRVTNGTRGSRRFTRVGANVIIG